MLSHFSSIISSDQIQEYLAQSFPRQWSGKWLKCLLDHHLFRLQKRKQFNICSDLGILQTSLLVFFTLILFSVGIDPFWYSWHRKIIIPPILQHIKNWNYTSPCWKDILSMCKALHHHLILANLAVWKVNRLIPIEILHFLTSATAEPSYGNPFWRNLPSVLTKYTCQTKEHRIAADFFLVEFDKLIPLQGKKR